MLLYCTVQNIENDQILQVFTSANAVIRSELLDTGSTSDVPLNNDYWNICKLRDFPARDLVSVEIKRTFLKAQQSDNKPIKI